jgi:signal transduction histidine kinase
MRYCAFGPAVAPLPRYRLGRPNHLQCRVGPARSRAGGQRFDQVIGRELGDITAETPVQRASDRRDVLAPSVPIGRDDSVADPPLEPARAVVPELSRPSATSDHRRLGRYALELIGVGLAYFVLAKLGLALASIHPSASPIWAPTGLALAAVMLWGNRVGPAIFAAAWLANATTAGSIHTALAIALGNTLEAILGGYLINRWSGGLRTFDSPVGVARFALISLLAATPISATIGLGTLTLAGYAEAAKFASTWLTWWLGDFAGAVVVAPVVVLWATGRGRSLAGRELLESAGVLAAAIAVGVLAFSPLVGQTPNRDPLGFLVILPLTWAALRKGQCDTATVALVLSLFAVWGTMAEQGPFARATLNESFLLLVMFMVSTAVPALALSADVAVRKGTERRLRDTHQRLDQIVEERTAALEETRQTLHQAQKMEALGQLTGGIAHDFNNVLTAITNSLESMRAAPGADAKTLTRLDRALQAARNGATLVQQMLVFARRHPLQLELLDVNEIVNAALALFRGSCPETVALRTVLEPRLRPVRADSAQLQTAILNLLVNARDAMPSGGRLTIRTSSAPASAEASATPPAGGRVAIEVSDTGLGMTPETAARAFEPFFTTKEIGKGTGLGLSMVYAATRQMGGDAAIESTPGEGTSVRLILPAAASIDDAVGVGPTAAPPAKAPTELLYVEDNLLVSLATVDLLEEAGYSIHPAPDARRALAILEEHPAIELMVTDVGLPGMDGHELAAEARRLRPDLKVLFLTGYDPGQWRGDRAPGPGTSYLGKPYQEQDLLGALGQLYAPGGPPGDRP